MACANKAVQSRCTDAPRSHWRGPRELSSKRTQQPRAPRGQPRNSFLGVRQGDTPLIAPSGAAPASGTATPGGLTSAWGSPHPTAANVRQRMHENILIFADWRLAGLVDDAPPPRNPNGDDDEEEEDEEEDEQRNDEPPVVREPEPDE